MQLGQAFAFLRAGRVRGTSWRTTRAIREENIRLLDEASIERYRVAVYVKVAGQRAGHGFKCLPNKNRPGKPAPSEL
jgi:hypothetical protein